MSIFPLPNLLFRYPVFLSSHVTESQEPKRKLVPFLIELKELSLSMGLCHDDFSKLSIPMGRLRSKKISRVLEHVQLLGFSMFFKDLLWFQKL